jgi:hypothetical protein
MKHKILAAILGFVNVLMVAYALQLVYLYNFTEIPFAIKLPIWLLVLYVVVGAWGVFVDRKLYRADITIKTALLQDLTPKALLLILEFYLF